MVASCHAFHRDLDRMCAHWFRYNPRAAPVLNPGHIAREDPSFKCHAHAWLPERAEIK
jgi:hypothetical protein